MPEDTYKTGDLEILVATMHRTSLDFLNAMFANNPLAEHSVLIINQTDKEDVLSSDLANVRVINTYDYGLSKSRNIAMKNAKGPICLIADDDVVFVKGFSETILQAFTEYNYPIITFKTTGTNGKPYWKYPNKAMLHNSYVSQKTLSIEIAFKIAEIIEKDLFFDERFGLGAQFQDAENFVFLTDAKKKGIIPFFYPQPISMHPPLSSSDAVETDRLLYAKAAIKAYAYKNLSYLWVLKFVFFIYRKKYIPFSEIPRKIKIGFKSISDYKKTSPNENYH